MPRGKTRDRDGIYTRKDRPGFWGSYIDGEGERKRCKLDAPTFTQAKDLLSKHRAKAAKQKITGEVPPTDEFFNEFAAVFIDYQRRRIAATPAKGKISQAEFDRQNGIVDKHLKPFFGGKKLALIRRKHVNEYIDSRVGKVSDGTIIKEVNCLKRLFSVAVQKEKISSNPAHGADVPQAPEGRNRWLSNEELHKVLKSCYIPPTDEQKDNGEEPEQWLQHAAGLAVALGTRRGELLNVTLPDISLDTRMVLLRKTKNGKPRPAFINDLAMQVLDSMEIQKRKRRKEGGLLFRNVTPAQLSMRFIRACTDAGIEDFSFHDLRHTYASHLRMNGADLHDIQIILGHSDPRMTNRYAHLSNAHLDKTAQRLNGVLTLAPVAGNEAEETAESSSPIVTTASPEVSDDAKKTA